MSKWEFDRPNETEPGEDAKVNYIRSYYQVPAKRGGRVKYTGGTKGERFGTIKSARGGYLMILLDGDKHPGIFHPTWKLEYLR